jgi:hypothetical protein
MTRPLPITRAYSALRVWQRGVRYTGGGSLTLRDIKPIGTASALSHASISRYVLCGNFGSNLRGRQFWSGQ